MGAKKHQPQYDDLKSGEKKKKKKRLKRKKARGREGSTLAFKLVSIFYEVLFQQR